MKFIVFLFAGTLLWSGTPRTTVQIDYWNWTLVKTPAIADGILVDPTDDNTWYVASDSGLLITRDGGVNWTTALQGPVLREAVAVDPSNSRRIYAGAGTSLYISEDKGATWTRRRDFSHQIASVMVSARDQSVFVGPRLALALSGIYQSADRGVSWQPIPFGASFPALSTTWDIAEDDSGALWAGTEAAVSTSGKTLLRSTDRGATWTDVSGPWNGSPTKILWDRNGPAMYVATPSGLFARSNLGSRWLSYNSGPVQSLSLIIGTYSSHLFIGRDESSGGGVSWGDTMSATGLADPNVFAAPLNPIGLAGFSITSIATNPAGTRVFAASGRDGIWTGTVLEPHLKPSPVFVTPGGALIIWCPKKCLYGGSTYTIALPGLPSFSTIQDDSLGILELTQRWDVPASLPLGTYPAQFSVPGFPKFNFPLVVGAGPTITALTSLRIASKPQYAPGEVVTLFGYAFAGVQSSVAAPANSSQGVPLQKQLADSQVLIDGAPVPLYYAFTGLDASSQINFQIPYSLAPGLHKLRVNRLLDGGGVDASSADFSLTVGAVSPTYSGSANIPIFAQNLTQDPSGNTFVTANSLMHPGDVLVVYATGLGTTSPAIQEGDVPPAGVLANVSAPVSVVLRSTTGQWTANVLGAVASPVYPGLYQIAFGVPMNADGGPGSTVDLVLTVGGNAQTFRLNLSRQ